MKKLFILCLSILGIFTSCDDEVTTSGGTNLGFNAEGLLTSMVNNHIIPDYTAMAEKTEALVTAKNTFIRDTSETSLIALRTAYLNAYKQLQHIGAYGGSTYGYNEYNKYMLYLNTYPTSVELIETNITTSLNIEDLTIDQKRAQGFPAIDYLINGIAADNTSIITALSPQHLNYLSIIIDKIDSLTDEVLLEWQGETGTNFIANSGSAIYESPNIFFNNFVYQYENQIRRLKIDNGMGFNTDQAFPELVESLYDPIQSKVLLIEAFDAFEALYLGTEDDTDSYSSVLVSIERNDLDTRIKNQFNTIRTAIEGLDDNLKLQLEEDRIAVMRVRDTMQTLVAIFKSDMASALNASVEISDSDGD